MCSSKCLALLKSNVTSTGTRNLEMLASIRNKLDNSNSMLQMLQNLNETKNCECIHSQRINLHDAFHT